MDFSGLALYLCAFFVGDANVDLHDAYFLIERSQFLREGVVVLQIMCDDLSDLNKGDLT